VSASLPIHFGVWIAGFNRAIASQGQSKEALPLIDYGWWNEPRTVPEMPVSLFTLCCTPGTVLNPPCFLPLASWVLFTI